MKKVVLSLIVLLLMLIATQGNAQIYDLTLHEAGSTAGVSLDSTGWAHSLICTDLFYTSIEDSNNKEEFYLYWFNDLKPFTAISIKNIPTMWNKMDLEFAVKYNNLRVPADSVFLYTSGNGSTWTFADKWGASGTSIVDTIQFTNVQGHDWVKFELKATTPSAGWYYYFSDFYVKADTGSTGTPAKPVVNFASNYTDTICEGDTVMFTDMTVGGWPYTRSWTFNSGMPSVSTDSMVSVAYNTAGTYDVTFSVTNPGGTDDSTASSLVVVKDCSVGLNDNLSTAEIRIYPNPVRDVVWFELPASLKSENLEVAILDLNGKLIRETFIQNSKIQINDLPVGSYFLRIKKGKEEIGTYRILVKS